MVFPLRRGLSIAETAGLTHLQQQTMASRGLAFRSDLWGWLRTYESRPMLNHKPDAWDGAPTFSLMDGGCVYLPVADAEDRDRLRTFYRRYANGIRRGEWFALSENRTKPVARLFFDVDAAVVDSPGNFMITSCRDVGQQVARAVGECVATDLTDAATTTIGRVIVLTPFNDRLAVFLPLDGGARKLSLHIVFPDIAVEAHVADAIRHVVAARLDTLAEQGVVVRLAPQSNGAATPWLTAFDPSPALRVPYSVKVDRCTCNPKLPKGETMETHKRRRRDESWCDWGQRYYALEHCPPGKCSDGWVPLFHRGVFKPLAVHEGGTGRQLRQEYEDLARPDNMEAMLLATSVRTPPGTPLSPLITWASCLAALARITGTTALPSTLSRRAATGEGVEWADVPLTAAVTGHLLAAVRAHHARFRRVDLAAVRMAPSGHAYRVDVCGDGSDQCLNLRPPAVHKCGAAPYFVISSRQGVTQRCACWSNSGDGRCTGKRCKEFKLTPTPVAADVKAVLFPPPASTTARFVPGVQPATAWRRKVPSS